MIIKTTKYQDIYSTLYCIVLQLYINLHWKATNINEQILKDHNTQTTNGGSYNRNNGSGCLKLIFALLILGPLGIFILVIITLIASWFGVIGGMGSLILTNTEAQILNTITESTGPLFTSGIICVLIILGVLFYLLLRLIFGSGKPMGRWVKTIIAILMFLCLVWGGILHLMFNHQMFWGCRKYNER